MNILFLSITRVNNINGRGIYTDLLRKFKAEGHSLFIVSPSERRYKEAAGLAQKDGVQYINVKTLNIQQTSFIEKGLATLLLEGQFLAAIKKYFSSVKFDLVLYTTPPVTFAKVISYVKKKDGALSYLLLKDIFPQNAVDIGLLNKRGLLYRFFRAKEKELYRISDYIGCMSPANVNYILQHNPGIGHKKAEVNPNSISPVLKPLNEGEKESIREKYNVPKDKVVYLYGGNLGKPQGVGFLMEVLTANKTSKEAFFLIIGNGTEFDLLKQQIVKKELQNVLLTNSLPKEDYDKIAQACDVGLIFLDRRFTIPNFPSRLLAYMETGLPVLLATDKSTDIGGIASDNNFGLWSESGDLAAFNKNLAVLLDPGTRKEMGDNGYRYLLENYTVDRSYNTIAEKFNV